MIPGLLLQQTAQSLIARFAARGASDPAAAAAILGTAFFLGAAHALTPGHGKALVAAYLAGSRGRLSDAVFLGGVVTLTHTVSVFVLGLVTLFAAQSVALDRIYPWLSLLSGGLIVAVGGWLLWQRIAGYGKTHSHGAPHPFARAEPKQASLLSLGISGGLVPCPEAMVLLMMAVSLRQVAFGIAALVCFSLGLAAILIAIGCAMVLARPWMERLPTGGRLAALLPIVSAAVVTLLGIAIVLQAAGSGPG